MKKTWFRKDIPSSEITPEQVYLTRRDFMRTAGVVVAGAALAACVPAENAAAAPTLTPAPGAADEALTEYDAVVGYNNFYEFSTNKEDVARLAKDFTTRPWTLEVGGLVAKPTTFGIEDFLARFPREERVYRLRCVEGWSMVIPWLGFPIHRLLKEVEPLSMAKYVRFETLFNPDEMPGQKSAYFPWPYQEGLRLDEAMHDLAILSTGLYGKELLPQNGAPVRLVVPWKYGFKSIKSIVKIELTDVMPATLWSTTAPDEYGFYANVNPRVAHPRWSQSSERRIGEAGRRPTQMFNGYEQEVAGLYAGMDLKVNY